MTGLRFAPAAEGHAAKPFGGQLQIDWTRCDGHGLCRALLPDRIEVDEWGFPILRDAQIPTGSEAPVRRAIAACPALALRLVPSTSNLR